MSKAVVYPIQSFEWDKETRTFSAEAKDLWCFYNYYNLPFPSRRKQFSILNETTSGWRRFRLTKDAGNDLYFSSEDGIICHVKNVNNLS